MDYNYEQCHGIKRGEDPRIAKLVTINYRVSKRILGGKECDLYEVEHEPGHVLIDIELFTGDSEAVPDSKIIVLENYRTAKQEYRVDVA